MAENWQMVRNNRWACLRSMASTSEFCRSQMSAAPACPPMDGRRDRTPDPGRAATPCGGAPAVRGAEERGCGIAQGVSGELPSPSFHGHHLSRGFQGLVRLFVEQPVDDTQIPVLLVVITVHAPEAVLLLALQHPLGGVEAGVGKRGPMVGAVPCYGVVESAAAQQPEVGHPGLPGGSRVIKRQVDLAAFEQVGGQPAHGHLHTPRRGGPGRVLVGCWAIARMVSLFTGDNGRPSLVFQMGRMVVVQGETFLEVLGKFALRVKGRQPCGPGLLPGAGMVVVGDVQRIYGLACEEPAMLPALGHASHRRGDPAAAAQATQHPSYVNNQGLPTRNLKNMLLSSDCVPLNEKRICHLV